MGLKGLLTRAFRKGAALGTVGALIGYIGIVLTATDLYLRLTSGAEPLERFHWYLWVSYFSVVLLFVGWATLGSKLRVELADMLKQVSVRDEGIRLQHMMAEVVRAAAHLRNTGQAIDYQQHLSRIGDLLKGYLRARLSGTEYSITVKLADGDRLKMIFRDSAQDAHLRAEGNDIPIKGSCIFTTFQSDEKVAQKRVLVRDVDLLDSRDHDFMTRAKKAKFRSVIGFPLRNPVQVIDGQDLGPLKCASIFGFISIDSPATHAFDGLFSRPAPGVPERNDGTDRTDLPDMDLFFGVADAVATLVVLSRRQPMAQGEDAAHGK